MTEATEQTTQEQAEAFVTGQIAQERGDLLKRIEEATKLEREAAKEHEANDAAYWKLSNRDLDGEPDAEEVEAQRKADASLRKLQGISAAISSNREKLAKLDNSFSRRVRTKREQLERGRNGNTSGTSNGKRGKTQVAKTETKRVPVPEATIKRVVELVKTKSQQEVADLLNKEGKTTASGKPWTPQNIWHLVKKATGKGVPRKASRNGGTPRKKTTAAKKKTTAARKTTSAKRKSGPISKKSQASGTSRGGTGSRKKKTTARRRGR